MATKVLIVEEDKKLAALLHKILTAKGFACYMALTASEGLNVVYTSKPDLVLCSTTLSNVSSTNFLALLVKSHAIPAIMISNNGAEADSLLKAGALACLNRNTPELQLFAFIKAVLQGEQTNATEPSSYKTEGPLPPNIKGTQSRSIKKNKQEAEWKMIINALRQADFRKGAAAKLLGIDRRTLYNKLRAMQIEADE